MVQRTLVMIKPDAMAKRVAGAILQRLLDEGFDLVALRLHRLSRSEAEAFYAVHRERPFFQELVDFMTSGPVVAACLQGEDAVARLRAVMGPTDSGKAPPETLRGRFGTDIQRNAVHGSDSEENARREVAFFFPELEPR
ncbi:MAG: nucleoside-diphosphate kinase [Acidobacteriota bacterium]